MLRMSTIMANTHRPISEADHAADMFPDDCEIMLFILTFFLFAASANDSGIEAEKPIDEREKRSQVSEIAQKLA